MPPSTAQRLLEHQPVAQFSYLRLVIINLSPCDFLPTGYGTNEERNETEDGKGDPRLPGTVISRRGHRVLQTNRSRQDEKRIADGKL